MNRTAKNICILTAAIVLLKNDRPILYTLGLNLTAGLQIPLLQKIVSLYRPLMTRSYFFIIVLVMVGCSYGRLPEKDLSEKNISYVELNFPQANSGQYPIRLDNSQIKAFSRIISKRKSEYVEPENCYDLLIKLKDGGSLYYRTDGLRFQGYDDTSDLPFSFSVEENILTEIFELKSLEHCK